MSVGRAVKRSRSRAPQSVGWPMNGATDPIEINRCIRPLLGDTTSVVVGAAASSGRQQELLPMLIFRCVERL